MKITKMSAINQIRNLLGAFIVFISLMGLCHASKRKMSSIGANPNYRIKASRGQNNNSLCGICNSPLESIADGTSEASNTEVFKFPVMKCGNAVCHRIFHSFCLINSLDETRKCSDCKFKYKKDTILQAIILDLNNLITLLSTKSRDEIGKEIFLNYFSIFNLQPVELLCSVFAATNASLYKIELFRERIDHFNRSQNGKILKKTLKNIISVLDKFIKAYKHFLKGTTYKTKSKYSSILTSLAFSDRLFYPEFLERSSDKHSLKKLNAATRAMKYIYLGREKLRYVHNSISFSTLKSIRHKNLLLLQESELGPGCIPNIMPYDVYLYTWNFEFNPTFESVRMTIRYNGGSDQITIFMTPMIFGILEKCYTFHKDNMEMDPRITRWNELFEKLKERCIKSAEKVSSNSEITEVGNGCLFSVLLIVRDIQSFDFKALVAGTGGNSPKNNTLQVKKINDLLNAKKTFSEVMCMNASPESQNNFKNDRAFLIDLFLFNNYTYIKQMIYIILHRKHLTFLDILSLIDTLCESKFKDGAVGYLLFLINEKDLKILSCPNNYNSLFIRLKELNLYYHALILDKYLKENGDYKSMLRKLAIEYPQPDILNMQSMNSPYIVPYYKTTKKSYHRAQVHAISIPILLEKAIAEGWSTLMPSICFLTSFICRVFVLIYQTLS